MGPRGGVGLGVVVYILFCPCVARSLASLVVERAYARWRCVSLRAVPTWSMGTATNSTFPQTLPLYSATSGAYLAVFSCSRF